MTTSEFDSEFDVLYNNVTSNQAPGLNRYEKSVFLTNAERQLVQEWINERIDATNGGFDGTSKRQVDLSNITVWGEATKININESVFPHPMVFDPRSLLYAAPSDMLYIVDEILWEYVPVSSKAPQQDDKRIYTALPINKDEYLRLMSKPYKYPPKSQVWRLLHDGHDTEQTSLGNTFEILGRFYTSAPNYRIRYIRKPNPIILEDLEDLGVSIDNETSVTECELPESTHREILERAVTLARLAWQGTTLTQAASAVQAQRRE